MRWTHWLASKVFRRPRLLLGLVPVLAMAMAYGEEPPVPVPQAVPGQAAAAPPAGKDASSDGLPRFERLWENSDLQHQAEAIGVSTRDGWLYVAGGGGQAARASKIRVSDGKVAWSVKAGSYQPSYPVSNGRIVILGNYYEGTFKALDDATGEEVWTTSDVPGAMASALFAGQLAFVGSYNEKTCGLYGLDTATGKARWKSPTEEKIWSTPVPYGDLVLLGCYDGYLYAIDQATGKRVWRLDCGGRVQSNPVVAGDLAFIAVDAQRVTDRYDGTKLRKHFLAVDLRERKILHDWTTEGEWDLNVVATPQQVFFSDRRVLYAYDIQRKALAYTITPPPGLLPYPVLNGDRLLLPVRLLPWECSDRLPPSAKAPIPIAIYDRKTGATITTGAGTGIAISSTPLPLFVQDGHILVTVTRPLAAYRLVTE